jgi:hypothetical protein
MDQSLVTEALARQVRSGAIAEQEAELSQQYEQHQQSQAEVA